MSKETVQDNSFAKRQTFSYYSAALFPVKGERTKTKIYVDIEGWSPCFRRMNGTHQIGCQCMYLHCIAA